MKRTIGALAALVLILASVVPAQAGGYYRGYGHHGYGHHGYRHGHHDYSGAYVALGIIGGALLLGTLLSRPSYDSAPAYQPAYATPAPNLAPSALRNCQPTTGTTYLNGRLASFGGTWCEDAYGNGYVIQGSEYFIGYAR